MKNNILEIIQETDDYLVINKPAGLIVHGGPGIKEKTLVDFLLQERPKLKTVGEDPLRPGIVHRLDKEVSGLMVIAKNQASFEHLKKQFQTRDIIKEYLALVYGKINKEEGEINFPIKRASSGHKMAALPLIKKGLIEKKSLSDRDQGTNAALMASREAITLFKIKQRLINYTLLELRIKTGRTHQIRVHLSAYGHPLVGDDLYGTAKTRIKNKKIALGRIFLFAQKLSFKDISGEKQEFKLALEPELEAFLKKLK
ncbi:MAG: RNA pseudouridine synthase [Patescibacteria group bacterium]